jgi:peptidoglycan/xylan/chitin deacetylase (PgdA/CDA1 family)
VRLVSPAAPPALALLVTLACASPVAAEAPRQSRRANRSVRVALPAGPPEVLFTFDDGPSLERTPKILDVLDQHHIKAVFFVNGMHFMGSSPAAEKARVLLREIVARGHAVGNHTVHHYFLCGKRGAKLAADEIERNARLIEEAIGVRPELYRTPYGAHCASLAATLEKLGIRHTGWDIDPQDWRVQNTRLVRDYVVGHLRRLHGRAIILMHDIHPDTVEALPQVLDWLDHENADRTARGDAPIRIIDYAYLLPPHPVVPPILDGIGRVLIEQWAVPLPVWRLVALATGARSSGS